MRFHKLNVVEMNENINLQLYPMRVATFDHFLSRVQVSNPPSSFTMRCNVNKSKALLSKFGILNEAPSNIQKHFHYI